MTNVPTVDVAAHAGGEGRTVPQERSAMSAEGGTRMTDDDERRMAAMEDRISGWEHTLDEILARLARLPKVSE